MTNYRMMPAETAAEEAELAKRAAELAEQAKVAKEIS